MPSTPSPLRLQTRAVVRSLLAHTALRLFAEKGYDRTTVEDVADAAGVSRRTLFNYFRTKEDLALGGIVEQGEAIAERFTSRPVDEDVWTSLRHAFAVLDEIEAGPDDRLRFISMLFENDSLRAGHAEKQARWAELLAPEVESRLGDSGAFEARAIVAAAIACLHSALQEWVRRGGATPMLGLYDIAVAAVRSTR